MHIYYLTAHIHQVTFFCEAIKSFNELSLLHIKALDCGLNYRQTVVHVRSTKTSQCKGARVSCSIHHLAP